MNWDEVVAVSQLIAAFGVILSLIFLAIQLQQNTKAVRSSSIQNLIQTLSTNAQAVVDNEYLVPLILKANTSTESLSDFVTYMDKQLDRDDARDLYPVFQAD